VWLLLCRIGSVKYILVAGARRPIGGVLEYGPRKQELLMNREPDNDRLRAAILDACQELEEQSPGGLADTEDLAKHIGVDHKRVILQARYLIDRGLPRGGEHPALNRTSWRLQITSLGTDAVEQSGRGAV
jgi:hypothetical protein